MGPKSRYLGPEVPKEDLLGRTRSRPATGPLIDAADIAALKQKILASGLTTDVLVQTAWASASTFRGSDKRGGANGGRIRLEPQRNWEVNEPSSSPACSRSTSGIKAEFNGSGGGKKVSIADLIVLGGSAAVGEAARAAGFDVTVPFTPGRTDASQEQTDIRGLRCARAQGGRLPQLSQHPAQRADGGAAVDRAQLLGLSAPEMTVAGRRPARARRQSQQGQAAWRVHRPAGQLTNDFFVNLLDMATAWKRVSEESDQEYVGSDRHTGEQRWTASRTDLVFGSNSQLRAIAEVYACDDAREKFVNDFIAAWTKVMDADRFDVGLGENESIG
jgi:catalase-peroxidase